MRHCKSAFANRTSFVIATSAASIRMPQLLRLVNSRVRQSMRASGGGTSPRFSELVLRSTTRVDGRAPCTHCASGLGSLAFVGGQCHQPPIPPGRTCTNVDSREVFASLGVHARNRVLGPTKGFDP